MQLLSARTFEYSIGDTIEGKYMHSVNISIDELCVIEVFQIFLKLENSR